MPFSFTIKMQRIVSSLLIPLVLVSHGFCAAHSHVGTSVVEPEGHSARPHIHLQSGTHHHDDDLHREHDGADSHEEYPALMFEEGPLDHDSDALYIAERQLFNDAKPGTISKAELSFGGVVCDESATIAGLRICIKRGLPPPLRDLKCPLYLRILSVRC